MTRSGEARRHRGEHNPIDQSPPCSAALDDKTCASLIDCHWCGSLGDRFSWACFEGSLWRCPHRPECQRAVEEFYGFRTGQPSPVVLVISVACFILTAMLFKRRCVDHFRLRRPRLIVPRHDLSSMRQDSLMSSSSSTIDVTEQTTITFALLERPPPKQLNLLTRMDRAVTRVLLVFAVAVSLLCVFVLVLSPAPPVFTACDMRWDLGSVHDNKVPSGEIQILAELALSIWNPNQFDIEVESARGNIWFHQGLLARFHWEPRGGQVRIASGHVYDTRVVISVDWSAVEKVPQLIQDWTSVDGIVLSLDAAAFMRLRLFGLETPRLNLAAVGIPLPLQDRSRDLCRCTTV